MKKAITLFGFLVIASLLLDVGSSWGQKKKGKNLF